MAKIYTSYFSNWRNFPVDAVQIGIVRYPPVGWGKKLNLPVLAPSKELLERYKNNDVDRYLFKILYLTELRDRNITPESVRKTLFDLSDNKDVILCCYEKPEDVCHRHFLAKWLGDDVEEL